MLVWYCKTCKTVWEFDKEQSKNGYKKGDWEPCIECYKKCEVKEVSIRFYNEHKVVA